MKQYARLAAESEEIRTSFCADKKRMIFFQNHIAIAKAG